MPRCFGLAGVVGQPAGGQQLEYVFVGPAVFAADAGVAVGDEVRDGLSELRLGEFEAAGQGVLVQLDTDVASAGGIDVRDQCLCYAGAERRGRGPEGVFVAADRGVRHWRLLRDGGARNQALSGLSIRCSRPNKFMYIIALNAFLYMVIVRYTRAMTAPKKEHRQKIADFRNSLADAIERARYFDETTVLTSRGKQVAVLVGMDFYERALEALGEERGLILSSDD